MSSGFDYALLDRILEAHDCAPRNTIAILQDVQEHYHYLPQEAFPYMAKRLNVGEARLYSVATFYENFSLEPKGKYVIKVCDGTACHVRKSIPILERLRNELGLSESKHTTDDLMFTLDTVSCLGACGLAPVMTIGEDVYGRLEPSMLKDILAKYQD